MENLRNLLEECINEQLCRIILSNAKDKMAETKVQVRPVLKKDVLYYQSASFIGTKVFHQNWNREELIMYLMKEMQEQFKQMELTAGREQITVLISKKGKATIKRKNVTQEKTVNQVDLSHNRRKQYLLEEGQPVEFLVDLGVQTKDGKIVHAKYDKFRQINRFLEFIRDVLPELQKKEKITILDFGCGKSYLTFAMYYYLKVLQRMDVTMIGLDLKEDVIARCNALKDKYGYTGLQFLKGDISTYEGTNQVDMVVTLHACDTATDYALEKAILWGAKVILSVPCCQHEVNKQIQSKELNPVLKYGLIKERMSALITDAYRANILEEYGYEVQILEFIDMEHTPKNILIRGIKRQNPSMRRKKKEEEEGVSLGHEELEAFLQIHPTLGRLMSRKRYE